MPAKVEFHFDFGSPNAYFAHKVIPAIEQRTGAHFDYVPILLGGVFKLTNNQPPMVQFKGIKNKGEYQRLEVRRFIKKHGLIRFRMNPHFPVNTVQIMRGAVAAGSGPALQRYVEVVFQAMWEEEKKLDDPEVIRTSLDAAGLDGQGTLARIQEQAVKDTLLKNTESSVARGTFGAPTFYVGEAIFFGKDSLGAVEEEIAATRA
jgi:2-hydroxychromene-2-carboxylate isomerase